MDQPPVSTGFSLANVPWTLVFYVGIAAIIIYFVIKYWGIIKWLGLGVGLAAAFPFLIDLIAGIIGSAALAVMSAIAAFRKGKQQGLTDDEAGQASQEVQSTENDAVRSEEINQEIAKDSGNFRATEGGTVIEAADPDNPDAVDAAEKSNTFIDEAIERALLRRASPT